MCAGEKGIVCDVEEIPIDYVNTAMERLVKNDVHYRQGRCSMFFDLPSNCALTFLGFYSL
jgi:hypothetical protein